MMGENAYGAANEENRALRGYIQAGFLLLALLIGGIGGWAVLSSISGAVIAQGIIVVESNIKSVQHKEGGIVGEIYVKNGQSVAAADLLVRMDDTATRARLAIVSKQLDKLVAQRARLIAERDGAEKLVFPPTLSTRMAEEEVAAAVKGEEALFAARRQLMATQKSQLGERIQQIHEEINGLTAQRAAKENEIDVVKERFDILAGLKSKGLGKSEQHHAAKRDLARFEGELGQLIAEIARAGGRISEIEFQRTQLDQKALAETVAELRETEAEIAGLIEQQLAARDQLERLEIRAPIAGTVHQLAVHTRGGVVAPGAEMMSIVPLADRLIIEARIPPNDIDQLYGGQPVKLRFPAFNQRTTPEFNGVIETVSADITHDRETQQSYFTTRIRLIDDQPEILETLDLVPGMPVEAFIQTTARSALSYLVKPISDQIAKAFRED